MVILATSTAEIMDLIKAGANFSVNCADTGDTGMKFTVEIARDNWTDDMTFEHYVYVPDTELGGFITSKGTTTTLDYVTLSGATWRGMLNHKIIKPPAGEDYYSVTGELNTVMKGLIEREFDGLFVVSTENTGVSVSNYKFDRYCTLLDGLKAMLKSKNYRLDIKHKRDHTGLYVLVSAVPIVDYSAYIEMSQDNQLDFDMTDNRGGINHLVCLRSGEQANRTVVDLYCNGSGTISETQTYTGLNERAAVYEYSGADADELRKSGKKKFKELMNSKSFSMAIDDLGIEDIWIGDIVGGRDRLTGMYMAEPIGNVIYSIEDGVITKKYKLEGEMVT